VLFLNSKTGMLELFEEAFL